MTTSVQPILRVVACALIVGGSEARALVPPEPADWTLTSADGRFVLVRLNSDTWAHGDKGFKVYVGDERGPRRARFSTSGMYRIDQAGTPTFLWGMHHSISGLAEIAPDGMHAIERGAWARSRETP